LPRWLAEPTQAPHASVDSYVWPDFQSNDRVFATIDLEWLLAMKMAVEKIKSLARQQRARMNSRCVVVTSSSQTVKVFIE
jgi:hypothetical protein